LIVIDFEVMSGFSSPLRSLSLPASRSTQPFAQRGEQTTPPVQSASTRSKGKAPDAKRVLSERLKMMEEDSPAASQGVQAVDEDCKSIFVEQNLEIQLYCSR
jgi:hypothetical protein